MSYNQLESEPMLTNASDCSAHVKNYNIGYTRLGGMGTKKHVAGAMRIMSRWPDHWLRSAGYWWIGIALLCLFILAIYNNATAMSMLSRKNTSLKPDTKQYKTFVNIYIIENSESRALMKYLPLIKEFLGKLPGLECYLLVLYDDNTGDTALIKDYVEYIHIKYSSLNRFINDSLFGESWRNLPKDFISFFVKAQHVWDYGGIVFDPSVLLPGLYKDEYVNKLISIIEEYQEFEDNLPQDYDIKHRIYFERNKEINNIQDVINNLDDNFDKQTNNDIDLKEEESKFVKFHDLYVGNEKSLAQIYNDKKSKFKKIFDKFSPQKAVAFKSNDDNINTTKTKITKAKNNLIVNEIPTFVTISGSTVQNGHKNGRVNLTIDLYGNILATNTPCHAFIDMLFTDLDKRTNDSSVAEYISSELNEFCKGKERTFVCEGLKTAINVLA